jgi:transcription elongation factor GreA
MADHDQKVYLTQEGKQKLQDELDYLLRVRRPEVARAIGEAKADGDISENAGYEDAKREQGFLEGRIMTLKGMLGRAAVIKNGRSDRVTLGSEVTVAEDGCEGQDTYLIVGSAEADPASGRISNVSPMGKALMDKATGESVIVNSPVGELRFKIMGIQSASPPPGRRGK